MKLSHFHTPEQTPTDHLPDCAIAIDVLRATTTIAQALHVGAESVQAFSSLDKLFAESESWPAEKRIRAGERGGQKVEGCDFGNSPLECTPEQFAGRRLFITTTNGTRALQCIQPAAIVLTAALVNRASIVDYLLEHQPKTVWMVASGWEGSYALEDTVCAGAIAQAIHEKTGQPLAEMAENDEVIGAVTLFQQWRDRLQELLHHASHGKRLLRLNNLEDIAFCSKLDILPVVPVQTAPGVLKNA
ncbi:MAG: 2-phosphosulfolactate phosphatase family protein [Synechococcales cyanobacterium CRU_2_2]|nr:2-phosphosulfolactate phosphatase family protein [Synechococcales cyanobacterium CRU_2_2]